MPHDPEIQTSSTPPSPADLTWKDHLTILGLLRLVFGHVRDSTNRKNNMLAMLYLSVAVFAIVMVRASSPCPSPLVSATPAASSSSSSPSRPALLPAREACPCRPPLPPAFFYALVAPIVLFLGGYLLRHPEIRALAVTLIEAKWPNGGVSLPRIEPSAPATLSPLASTLATHWSGKEGDSSPPPPPPPPPLVRD